MRHWLQIAAIACAFTAAAAAQGADKDRFTSLFDGKTLKGWHGDPTLWSVQDGAITGTTLTKMTHNTFLISDRTYSDFELHFKFRMPVEGNSGVQFRSAIADPQTFLLRGDQANVVPPDQGVRYGMLYDNLGRLEIGLLSEKVTISSDQGKVARTISGSVNPLATLLAQYRPYPAWNDYVVIAYGKHIVFAINGYMTLDAVDEDPRAMLDGVLGLQLDFGPPTTVQYKDIEIRPLKVEPKIEGRFISAPGPAETTPAIPKRAGASKSWGSAAPNGTPAPTPPAGVQ
jgi:hypothetical protein